MLTIENHTRDEAEYIVTMQAHYSGSARQTLRILAVLASWFTLIFLWCTSIGAWPIVLFSLIVIMAVTLSFQYSLSQANNLERLLIGQHQCVWESCTEGKVTRTSFNSGWLKVHAHFAFNGDCENLTLQSHNQYYTLAKHVTYEERARLYQFLKSKLGFAFP